MGAPQKRRSDTRERIQEVALELFLEQGYDRTSLREIAERLEVTKAALYYHFKTKEDIIGQLVEDAAKRLDEVVDWAAGREHSTENRQELVRRYANIVDSRTVGLMRFVQENQTSMRELESLGGLRDRMKALFAQVSDPDAPLADQVRWRLALVSIHMGKMTFRDTDVDEQELDAAALEVALDLMMPRDPVR
jgi:AcrR family transcriptional regulator